MSSPEEKNSHTESLSELFARQFGLVTARQARSYGVHAPGISRRVASGEWIRVFPGVYRLAAVPVTPRQSALAAVLWAGDSALVSHATAATLFEFDGVRTQKVEIWVPSHQGVRGTSVTVHRGGRLDRADRTTLHGIPITTPVRTLIDIAGRLEDDRLLAVTEDLIRRGLVKPERLRVRLAALRKSGRVGGGRLAGLLDGRGDGRPLESALEAMVWRLIVESGVHLPLRQFWVTAAGRRYRLDFAWPDLKIAVECDGQGHHGDSRWNPDRARLADLASIEWRVMPITWDACIHERERVIARLKRAVPRAA
jgi:very-short-patch-repair endonuclease